MFVKSQRSEFQHEQWLGLDDVTIGAEIDQRVADGGLQIGISTDRGKIKAVRFLPLYQEYGCLYCGASHPLFGLEDVDITLELVNQQRFAQHAYSEAEIRDEQLVGFSPVASGQFTEGIALLILSGNFIGFLPEHYARNWVESGQMRQLLPAHVRKTTKIRLLYGAGASETPLVSAFVGTAKKVNDALGQSSSVSD
ncbi:LysR substrate binding domain protein [Roseovarius albus]|uniref:LysR substrate binding domain protein n=1 Tax=Roseovarius albus TaxID=1247867 RepID=A0A1X6ZYP1_9RHOB|nr:LysR substrate binding domain protein [Roseovarius albus]